MSDTTVVEEFYLQPPEFFDELLESRRNGRISDKLSNMFMTLASRIVNHRNYNRYIWMREDLIAEGCLACVYAFGGYNPYRKPEDGSPARVWDGEELTYHHTLHYSPFSFFTRCMENSLKEYLRRYYNAKNAVNSTRVHHGLEPDPGYLAMLKKKEDEKNGIEYVPEVECIEQVLSMTDNMESAGIRYSKLYQDEPQEMVDDMTMDYLFSGFGDTDEPDIDGFVYLKDGNKMDEFGIVW